MQNLTSYSVLNAIRGFILINILNRRNIITEYFLAFMLITAFFDLTLNPSPKERDLQPTPTKAIRFFCMVSFSV